MKKYRMVVYTMSDGSERYGIEKNGWFGWRVQKVSYYGFYHKHIYDKRAVQLQLDELNKKNLHVVSKKEVE